MSRRCFDVVDQGRRGTRRETCIGYCDLLTKLTTLTIQKMTIRSIEHCGTLLFSPLVLKKMVVPALVTVFNFPFALPWSAVRGMKFARGRFGRLVCGIGLLIVTVLSLLRCRRRQLGQMSLVLILLLPFHVSSIAFFLHLILGSSLRGQSQSLCFWLLSPNQWHS
ncbi:hypothetical protein BD289DRAFT_263187 [Coniella lustricola]|uniref:Uncharacterized protein n=1 Tax=Coniella lustricola TaxID=2025994 RepID=A0A2T3A7H1_9PEZI|nr:hypothetical protein BD289DRAFT_263187 [Coniella lustricola]